MRLFIFNNNVDQQNSRHAEKLFSQWKFMQYETPQKAIPTFLFEFRSLSIKEINFYFDAFLLERLRNWFLARDEWKIIFLTRYAKISATESSRRVLWSMEMKFNKRTYIAERIVFSEKGFEHRFPSCFHSFHHDSLRNAWELQQNVIKSIMIFTEA